jgi:hypothetical protein
VVGWFKWSEPKERKPCHLLFRLTNNEKDYLDDAAKVGDRTLAAFYCTDLHFSTYTIGTIDKDFKSNVGTKFEVGEYSSLWTYIYFGYSRIKRECGIIVAYPDKHYFFKI